MSIYGKIETAAIYSAKSINEAIRAYNAECEQCLKHGCDGDFCAASKALRNVSNSRRFSEEMQKPDIRKQVTLALDMG